MLRISQCKTGIDYTEADLIKAASKKLNIPAGEIISVQIVKQSLDARKKPQLFYSQTLDVQIKNEEQVLKKQKNNRDVNKVSGKEYEFPYTYQVQKGHDPFIRPVIIGAGPAGLVCAYYLAKGGFRPIVLERGKCAQDRMADVQKFWESGVLDTQSNVQFGEGGAGTFSDGKLNTLVKDKFGRCRAVLSLFVQMGAPEKILYDQKPHVGTDKLIDMVTNLRNAIIQMGGEIRFETQVTDIRYEDGKICEIETRAGDVIRTDHVVLAVGHSARDTFEMLLDKNIEMYPKSFAVGLRVQHPQSVIDNSQYGKQDEEMLAKLGAASYKLTAQTENGRGVYTFCMCPGGYVVNASSEEGRLAVNGMSYHARDSKVANSAVIITVTPDDFAGTDPLAGVRFQRELEQKTYELCAGKIPVQRYEDYKEKQVTADKALSECEHIRIKGAYQAADLSGLFPEPLYQSFMEGMEQFDRKIHGFAMPDTILAGVESRTSSPVRIQRDEQGMASLAGLYPCGEGAGYAGGITSAAMDGIYIAECVARDMLKRE